jgi:hypothetical protein
MIEWKKEMSGSKELRVGDMWFHDERWRDEGGYLGWPLDPEQGNQR